MRLRHAGSPLGYNNRVETVHHYDPSGRLAMLIHKTKRYNGSAQVVAQPWLLELDYLYDAASRIGQIDTYWNTTLTAFTNRADEVQSFTYDLAGQLTVVTDAAQATEASYAYGANGNRDEATEPGGGSNDYATGPQNRVSQDSTHGYQYDDEGNLIERWILTDAGERTYYTWDHRHRLVKVADWMGDHEVLIVDYRYNSGGDLVYRRVEEPFEGGAAGAQIEHYAECRLEHST